MLIYSTIADTCYTDFTKMTGTIIKNVAVTVSATECAFQCQIISSENGLYKKFLFLYLKLSLVFLFFDLFRLLLFRSITIKFCLHAKKSRFGF
jgi:hypothetical protein